jgi:tRNA threonylcarbamoyladenosine biosynthesis protein TsaB
MHGVFSLGSRRDVYTADTATAATTRPATRVLKLLALETSTESCSVALQLDGRRFVRRATGAAARAGEVLTFVDAVTHEAGAKLRDLDGIAFGRGPGSFTGVRMAVAVAQGLAYAANLRLVGVSSLEAVAHQALQRHPDRQAVLVCNDARMSQVYACGWRRDSSSPTGLRPVGPEVVRAPAELLRLELPAFLAVQASAGAAVNAWLAAGSGWAAYPALQDFAATSRLTMEPDLRPDAAALLDLAAPRFAAGEATEPRDAAPVYVRDDVATPPDRARVTPL